MQFFGRSMFFGIGGLISGAFVVALEGGRVPMIEVVWLVIAAVWTLLGMLGRTFAWR
jgi:hypothetical protein